MPRPALLSDGGSEWESNVYRYCKDATYRFYNGEKSIKGNKGSYGRTKLGQITDPEQIPTFKNHVAQEPSQLISTTNAQSLTRFLGTFTFGAQPLWDEPSFALPPIHNLAVPAVTCGEVGSSDFNNRVIN